MTTNPTPAYLIDHIRTLAETVFLALRQEGREVSQTDILLDEIGVWIQLEGNDPETALARLAAAMVLLTDIPMGETFTNRRYGALEVRTRRAWALATNGMSLEELEALEVLPEDRGGVWLPAYHRHIVRLPDGTREEAWIDYLQFHSRQAMDRAVQNDLGALAPAAPDVMPQAMLDDFRAMREGMASNLKTLKPALATPPWEVPVSAAKQLPTQDQFDRLFADIIAGPPAEPKPPHGPRILARFMPRSLRRK